MGFPTSSHRSEGQQPLKIAHTDASASSIISDRLSTLFARTSRKDIVVVCIGTDRSTGDSLGPLVGSRLLQLGFPNSQLYGTLDHPVHAMNLIQTMKDINRNHMQPWIVAIDACLGQSSSVGCVQLGEGPVKPGAGVNKDLPPVGNIHLTGIVNVGGFMEYFVLQNTRLSLVFHMANLISASLHQAFTRSERMYSTPPVPLDLKPVSPLEKVST